MMEMINHFLHKNKKGKKESAWDRTVYTDDVARACGKLIESWTR